MGLDEAFALEETQVLSCNRLGLLSHEALSNTSLAPVPGRDASPCCSSTQQGSRVPKYLLQSYIASGHPKPASTKKLNLATLVTAVYLWGHVDRSSNSIQAPLRIRCSVPNTVFFRRPWSFNGLFCLFGLILVFFLIKKSTKLCG